MTGRNGGLGFGTMTVKYLVFLFNLVFFISGLILIVVGGVAQGFFKEYVQFFDDELKTPAMGLILLGVVIVIVSFFGCCGASMENVYMLRIFAFLLCLLLVCEVVAGISVAILKSDVEEVITTGMNKSIEKYNNTSLAKDTWDNIQEKLHCCGTKNYTDWRNADWSDGSRVPDSCCKKVSPGCGEGALDGLHLDNINQNGCLDSLMGSVRQNLGAIIGIAVGIAVIQLVGIWMSCCLIRLVKEHYEVL